MAAYDLTAAFDSLDASILDEKLSYYGLDETSRQWISSFLYERRQYVVVGNGKSACLDMTVGSPQGSILSPLLFIIYRVFHSGVDWHITYNISETYVCIKTKFCTCVHELFTSNFCFNNFFLRPLTLAVLIRYYVHFDDFFKAFYVFLKFSPF